MRRRSPFPIAAIAALTACATAGSRAETRGQADVRLIFPGDADAARDALILAFEQALEEGANPRLRRGGNRFRVVALTTLRGRTAHLRARLAPAVAPSETVIVLSGFHRDQRPFLQARPSFAPGPEERITSTCTHTCAAFWGKLQRVVDLLQENGAETTVPGSGSRAE